MRCKKFHTNDSMEVIMKKIYAAIFVLVLAGSTDAFEIDYQKSVTREQAETHLHYLVNSALQAREVRSSFFDTSLPFISLMGVITARSFVIADSDSLINTFTISGSMILSGILYYMTHHETEAENQRAEIQEKKNKAWSYIQFLASKTIDKDSRLLVPQTRYIKRYAFTKQELRDYCNEIGITHEEFNGTIAVPRNMLTLLAAIRDNKIFQPL